VRARHGEPSPEATGGAVAVAGGVPVKRPEKNEPSPPPDDGALAAGGLAAGTLAGALAEPLACGRGSGACRGSFASTFVALCQLDVAGPAGGVFCAAGASGSGVDGGGAAEKGKLRVKPASERALSVELDRAAVRVRAVVCDAGLPADATAGAASLPVPAAGAATPTSRETSAPWPPRSA
jgi:hypothetical protein